MNPMHTHWTADGGLGSRGQDCDKLLIVIADRQWAE